MWNSCEMHFVDITDMKQLLHFYIVKLVWLMVEEGLSFHEELVVLYWCILTYLKHCWNMIVGFINDLVYQSTN